MSKTRNKALVEDDRWKRKGGGHRVRRSEPKVCPFCSGTGWVGDWNSYIERCITCDGTGEIWE